MKAAFTGKAAEVSADFDWERAINTARVRTMGDADILIKLEQYPQIQAIMERLQFTF